MDFIEVVLLFGELDRGGGSDLMGSLIEYEGIITRGL